MEEKQTNNRSEIRVNKVNERVKEQLEMIARNKGVTLSGFLKGEMPHIIERNKDILKRFRNDA